MIPLILIWVGLFGAIVALLWWKVPGFDQQERLAQLALSYYKQGNEVEGMTRSQLGRLLFKQLQKRNMLIRLFGSDIYQKYLALEREERYEQAVVRILTRAVIFGTVPYGAYLVMEDKLFLALTPVMFIIFLFNGIDKIRKDYKKRQAILTRDLPNLIAKMLIALESDRSLDIIFREVSEDEGTSQLLRKLLLRLLANTEYMPIQDAIFLFAMEVDLTVIYDFSTVVNVILEKGFEEAEEELNEIKDDIRELSDLSLMEQTAGRHERMAPVLFAGAMGVLAWAGYSFFQIVQVLNQFQ